MTAATRAATRETMIRIAALVLLIGIGFLVPKAAGTVSTAQTSRLPNTQLTLSCAKASLPDQR